jgi:hypothetical protein
MSSTKAETQRREQQAAAQRRTQQHNDEHNKQNKHPNGIAEEEGGGGRSKQQHQHPTPALPAPGAAQEQKQEQHQNSTRSSLGAAAGATRQTNNFNHSDCLGLKPAVEEKERDSKGVDGVEYKHRINMDRKNYHLVFLNHHQDNNTIRRSLEQPIQSIAEGQHHHHQDYQEQ